MNDLMKMIRDEPVHSGGPVEAMVPHEEVEHWCRHGWRIAEEPAEEIGTESEKAEAPDPSAKPKRRHGKRSDD